MPYITTRDGVRLYFEEAGVGVPIVFIHELSGDYRSWEPQLRRFARGFRCIAFNARGYPPSDVPSARSRYSQSIAADDVAEVLRGLGLRSAHIVGSAMGANTAIAFGMRHSDAALSLTAINAGVGADPDPAKRAQFLKDIEVQASRFERLGLAEALRDHRVGPSRIAFMTKDPRGFAEFAARSAELSALGLANTMRGIHAKRRPVPALEKDLRRLRVPLLLVVGDQDDKCLEPAVFMNRVCPSAALAVIPWSGHLVNLEEPDAFNDLLFRFLTLVGSGRWSPRDARSRHLSVLSNKG